MKTGRPVNHGTISIVALHSKTTPHFILFANHGQILNPLCIALTMFRKFVTRCQTQSSRLLNLNKSNRTIDYTWTLTFFQTPKQAAWLCFFTGNKINTTFHLHQTNVNKYNYSILPDNTNTQSTVTPCSIAVCKSFGNSTTSNKICCVLFDSSSSKTLVHKQIVPRNYTLISSHDDLRVLLLAGATTPMTLVALEKIHFPEFNCNIVIDKHPALIVNSMNL